MKRLLTIAIALMATASVVSAQVGNINMFADQTNKTDCMAVGTGPLLSVYLFNTNAVAVSATQFKLDTEGDAAGVSPLGFNSPFALVIGDPLNGVAISYGSCLPAFPGEDIYLGQLNLLIGDYACGTLRVVPDPSVASGQIEFVDCASTLVPSGMADGVFLIDGDGVDCSCNIPTREATWGKIKDLYK